MALEHSVLIESVIKELLKTQYNLNIISTEKLGIGTANCYRLFDGNKYYFLKEFQSGFSEEDLIREANLVNFLAENGFPVARFLFTVEGKTSITYCNHLLCLDEYIEGKTYGYNDFPKSMLAETAQMLGKLHYVMKDYPLPKDMGTEWLASYSADAMIAQYDTLLAVAEQNLRDANYTHIIADLQYKKELAQRCNDYKQYFEGITYSPTHGDFQGCQLICDGENIKAVIDFSSARTLPAVWEIMRSYVQTSVDCRKNEVIDTEEVCKYVQEYMKYSPLTKKDLAAMPYVYLFQLARSKYGYPQYLTTDSEDREGLLQFAFWRTNMCREVEKKAEEISAALSKLM